MQTSTMNLLSFIKSTDVYDPDVSPPTRKRSAAIT